jgi:hypothetical protein
MHPIITQQNNDEIRENRPGHFVAEQLYCRARHATGNTPMKKSDIQKLRIDIVCDGKSALSLLMDREGRVSRQGSGELPADDFAVMSEGDGSIFAALVDALDEQVFDHAGVYDHPDKSGLPITYSVAFLGNGPDEVAVFEFRLGTETKDVGELLPYFSPVISKAVMATNDWYAAEKGRAGEK